MDQSQLKILSTGSRLCLIIALWVSGCDFNKKRDNTKSDLKTIRLFLSDQPLTYDWQKSKEVMTGTLSLNLMQGLFTYPNASEVSQVSPQLVDQVKVSPNFKHWTFCLKKEVRWSDGVPLSPQHFITSWRRLLNPLTASPHAHHFFSIENAEAFYKGEKPWTDVGIKVNEKNCLEVKMNFATPLFNKILASPYTFPLREENLNPQQNIDLNLKSFVSLGAYKVNLDCSSQKLCLKPNSFYLKNPAQHTIELFWLDSENTAYNLFKQKKLDLVRLKSNYFSSIDAPTSRIQKLPSMGLTLLGFNLKNSEVFDRQNRESIKQLIQKDEIQSLFKDQIQMTNSLYPHISLPTKISPPQWELSQKITPSTIEAETPVAKQIKRISITSNSSPHNKSLLEKLADQLRKSQKFTVDIELLDPGSYFNQLMTDKNHSLFRPTWSPALLDPYGYLSLFTSHSGFNFFGYNDSDFDSKLDKAFREVNDRKREQLYASLENQILDRDTIAIPLFTHQETLLLENSLKLNYKGFYERLEFSSLVFE